MTKHPHTACFTFHGSLCDFPGTPEQGAKRRIRFGGRPGVKDLIEAQGIPHVEVDAILVNGRSTDFNTQLTDGDRIEVFDRAEEVSSSRVKKLKPAWEGPKRFVLDGHLGSLARDLRLLGIDAAYMNNTTDKNILSCSLRDHRIVLTRDIGLLRDGSLKYGRWIRNTEPEAQLREVVDWYQLKKEANPFSRCLTCNGPLQPVGKAKVRSQLPPRVEQNMTQFKQCSKCGNIYWRGSHYDRLLEKVRSVLRD